MPFEYKASDSYGGAVEQFKQGSVQLAWFGGLTGVQARHAVSGAQAIAQGEEDPYYKSYFIANAKTKLKPSKDFPMGIAGKSFTFGSPRSTSGRLMPEHFIRQFTGKSPEEFLGSAPAFSGKHPLTVKQVADGTFDVGVVSYTTYDKMVKAKKIDPKECIIIWKTPGYPDYSFNAHPILNETFGDDFIRKLQVVLIDINDPKILAGLGGGRKKLILAKNSDFEAIKILAEKYGFIQ